MFNNTLFNNNVIKKTLILATFSSLFIVGCSNDQTYKREIDGNEDYLNSPALKPLIVPQGVTVPAETADFYIYTSKTEGEVGKQVNIRPPLLAIPTVVDSYASCANSVVTLDAPASSGVWDSIPATLGSQNITIESSDSSTIRTGNTLILRGDEQQSVDASFIIQRHSSMGREYITVALNSLSRAGQSVSTTSPEAQRYVVGLFNSIMDAVAPASSRLPPAATNEDSSAE